MPISCSSNPGINELEPTLILNFVALPPSKALSSIKPEKSMTATSPFSIAFSFSIFVNGACF
jgi:hypothetical protein